MSIGRAAFVHHHHVGERESVIFRAETDGVTMAQRENDVTHADDFQMEGAQVAGGQQDERIDVETRRQRHDETRDGRIGVGQFDDEVESGLQRWHGVVGVRVGRGGRGEGRR